MPNEQDILSFFQSASQGQVADIAQPPAPKTFQSRNTRQGVAFDPEVGLPLDVVAATYLRRTPNEQADYLVGRGYSTRFSDAGDIIVGFREDDGSLKETLLNRHGFNPEDIAQFLSSSATEILGGVGGQVAAKKLGLGGRGVTGLLVNVAANVIGSQAAGTTQDISTRLMDSQSIQPGEIASERVKRGLIEGGIGLGIGAFPKIAARIISPFNNKGPIEFDGEAAEQALRQAGILTEDIVKTPATATGSTVLAQIESVMQRKPGARGLFSELDDKFVKQVDELQRAAVGKPLLSQSEVGKNAVNELGTKTFAIDRAVDAAKYNVSKVGTQELKDLSTQITGVIPMRRSDVGQQIRDVVMSDKAQFDAAFASKYNALETNPIVAERSMRLADSAKGAEKLKKEFPRYIIDETEMTGLVDEYNMPITVTRKGEKILPEFVPGKVRKFVDVLVRGKDQEIPLKEMLRMRTEVRNSISEAKAFGNVETHYLGKLEDNLTSNIKGELGRLDAENGTELLKEWTTINDGYATGISRYQRSGIAELFREPTHPPYVTDSEIVTRATKPNDKASDYFRAYEEFLGANNPAMAQVRRAVVDEVVGMADISTGLVDAKSVLSRLNAFYKDAPDVSEKVFGKNISKFARIAEAMSVSEGKVDINKLIKLASEPNATTTALRDLIEKENAASELYRNRVMKTVSAGTPMDEKLNPYDVVARIADAKRTTPQEAKELMQYLSGTTTQDDVAAVAAKQIFDKATHLYQGKKQVSGIDVLQDIFRDKDHENVYRTVLGDRFDKVVDIARVIRAREHMLPVIRTGAGLSAPQEIAEVVHLRNLGAIAGWGRNLAMAIIYTNPLMSKYASSTLISRDTAAALSNSAIAAVPFAAALARLNGEGALQQMQEYKKSIDENAVRNAGKTALNNEDDSMLNYFKSASQKASIAP